jgi:hypothetical protein
MNFVFGLQLANNNKYPYQILNAITIKYDIIVLN